MKFASLHGLCLIAYNGVLFFLLFGAYTMLNTVQGILAAQFRTSKFFNINTALLFSHY